MSGPFLRLQRINVEGFGALRDVSVEPGPGLTVLHGANEAGKSTLFNFVKGVLFGYGRRGSPGRFAPAVGAMGGSLAVLSHHGRYTIGRHVRRKHDELQVLNGVMALEPESRLNTLLGGLEPAHFSQYFAFDLEALQAAADLYSGDRMYEGLLGAVVPGAAALPGALATLSTSAGEIFAPTARKKPLNEALEELQEVQAELRGLAGRVAEYAKTEGRAAELRQAIPALREAQASARALAARAQQRLAARPLVERLLAARAQLSRLPAV
ncbi:MAG: AAA family ATPase, partial [Myxococcaceae bacterium]|nr:AAA family ATPase [Myxococcaceae bacterium]